MKVTIYFKLGVLSVSAMLLAGCGFTSPVNLPQDKTYTLNSVSVKRMYRESRTSKTLLVTVPVPNPGYASNKMVYVDVPFNLRYFANHQWAAPPSEMLLTQFANAIHNAGYFKAVVTAPFSGVTQMRLDTRLIALEQNFIHPRSREELNVEATLTNNITNQVIATRDFRVSIPAGVNTPYGGVLAANKAAKVISKKLAQFVVSNAG